MPRYRSKPQPLPRLIRAEEEEEGYDQDRPCIYDLEVEGTGLVMRMGPAS
jgi:hypothetical protein